MRTQAKSNATGSALPDSSSLPPEKRAFVRSMFNRIAPTYDILNRLLSLGIDQRWRRKTLGLMNLESRSVVLDLACGTGDLSHAAADLGVKTLFAVDPSHEMLRCAQAKLKFSAARSYFIESFGEEIPLASNLCSHAMIAFGIRNVQERPRAFAEIYRILKPGGVLAVLEFTPMDRKLVSLIFNLYFHKILPFVGGLISRDRQAYEYLPESVARFVTAKDLAREAKSVGFSLETQKVFSFGIATTIVLRK